MWRTAVRRKIIVEQLEAARAATPYPKSLPRLLEVVHVGLIDLLLQFPRRRYMGFSAKFQRLGKEESLAQHNPPWLHLQSRRGVGQAWRKSLQLPVWLPFWKICTVCI
jgi:hypothetical protein